MYKCSLGAGNLRLLRGGAIFLVEGMVVDLDLGESSEVVGHQHHRNVDVLQLPDRVVDPPHEDREERIMAPENFPLRVFHLEPLGLGLGEALEEAGSVHGDRLHLLLPLTQSSHLLVFDTTTRV